MQGKQQCLQMRLFPGQELDGQSVFRSGFDFLLPPIDGLNRSIYLAADGQTSMDKFPGKPLCVSG